MDQHRKAQGIGVRSANRRESHQVSREKISDLDAEKGKMYTKINALLQLTAFYDFGDIDWRRVASEIESSNDEIIEIKSGSDMLKSLRDQYARA